MRTRRQLLLAAAVLAVAAGTQVAQAATVGYVVRVSTPDFGAPGWIDLSFNQANATDSLPATATVWNFIQTGYTLDTATQSTPGVTGVLGSGPLVIPNDQGGANYFTQGVQSWGSYFQFTVFLDGPAIGTPALAGSDFRVTLFDSSFTPFAGPLASGEVVDITVNLDGSVSTQGSTFAGGFATVEPVPEPAVAWLLGPALCAMLLRRRK